MSTTTQHLGLIQPALSEKHGATTYKTNNATIDQAYGEYLNNYENSLTNIAPIEGDTASTNYSVGQYLVKDGNLYKVTASIASGESIVVGTNVVATSLNEAVASLNNAVASINNAIGTVNVATSGNLQSQVNSLQDSVSPTIVQLSPVAGLTLQENQSYLVKVGKTVRAYIHVKSSTALMASQELLDIPAGYRPSTIIRLPGTIQTTGNIVPSFGNAAVRGVIEQGLTNNFLAMDVTGEWVVS